MQNDGHDGCEELKALLYNTFGIPIISAIADPVFYLSYPFLGSIAYPYPLLYP
jgi:hypothetical protein